MKLKTKNIISWLLAGLLALVYIGSGFSKLLGSEMDVKGFQCFGYPDWWRYPVGLMELSLGLGLFFRKYRLYTVYLIFLWVIGAVITHIQAHQMNMIVAPLILGVFAIALMFVVKAKTIE